MNCGISKWQFCKIMSFKGQLNQPCSLFNNWTQREDLSCKIAVKPVEYIYGWFLLRVWGQFWWYRFDLISHKWIYQENGKQSRASSFYLHWTVWRAISFSCFVNGIHTLFITSTCFFILWALLLRCQIWIYYSLLTKLPFIFTPFWNVFLYHVIIFFNKINV